MKVKQRLKINAVVSVITIFIIFLILSLALYRVNKANDAAKIAGDIIVNSFERVTLRNDYLRNNNERAKVQWFARHEEIRRILKFASKDFQAAEDKMTIDEMLKNHESIRKIFSAMVENREKTKSNANDVAISQEVEDRLLSQLNMKVYQDVLYGRELLESSRKARDSIIWQAGAGIVCSFLVLLAAVIINSWMMGGAIADRVRMLRDGASLVGGGDLDHRIDVKGDDEFAELSGAFNAMTARLRGSYHDLEKEVEERKRTEESLRESREDMARAQAVGQIGSWRLDVNRNVLTWSDENHRIFGLPKGTPMSYETFLSIVHPDDREYVDRKWKAGLAGEPYDIEHRIIADGTVKWVREKAYLEFGENGSLLGGFGITQDITERKRAEEALREGEARYRSLFENMMHGFAHCMMLYDEGGRPLDFIYLDVNSAFGKLTGLENVLGKKVTEVIPGIREAHPELFDVYGRVALTGLPEKFEIEFKPLELWLSISVYSPSQEHFVAIFDDITERRKAEADVLKLSEDMAARNVELEMVNKELESFIYSISHDLRAPLRSMSGFARIVVEDYAERLDKLGKDYLVRILRGSEKMTRLIDDLLHLSKISRQEMERTEVDMSKMASSIVADLLDSDPGRSVKADITEGLVAFADPRLIEIVLSNLLGNAWKFTAKTANARIEFGALDHDGKAVFFVKDNGAGFNPEYTEKMFWPFHRLHSDKEFEGTGIGLTIVERIVHRHGGKVWAEGEKGKGATIYFMLGHGDKSSP